MDILVISRCPPFPLYYGERLTPYHLARQLSERHHHIDLIAFYSTPEEAADIPRYERFFRNIRLVRQPGFGGLRYFRRLSGGDLFPTRAAQASSREMWKAIQERVSTTDYDVVQVFGGMQVYEYRDLIKDIPTVVVPFESQSLALERALDRPNAGGKSRLRRQLFTARRNEGRIFTGFDRVVVLSEPDASALRVLRPDLPLMVIPNGVDTDYYVPTGREPDEPALIFVGNFERAGNVDAALRLARHVFPAVRQRVPKARLMLVGNRPPPEMLALQSSNIQVTGRVPDVRPYLEQALVFVSPLRMGAGIKNKILEAMAMQKAIVATPQSVDGIDLQSGTHLMVADTTEEIVKSITRLMRDGELRVRIAANARELIETVYTWKRIGQRYEELFREISWRRIGR